MILIGPLIKLNITDTVKGTCCMEGIWQAWDEECWNGRGELTEYFSMCDIVNKQNFNTKAHYWKKKHITGAIPEKPHILPVHLSSVACQWEWEVNPRSNPITDWWCASLLTFSNQMDGSLTSVS